MLSGTDLNNKDLIQKTPVELFEAYSKLYYYWKESRRCVSSKYIVSSFIPQKKLERANTIFWYRITLEWCQIIIMKWNKQGGVVLLHNQYQRILEIVPEMGSWVSGLHHVSPHQSSNPSPNFNPEPVDNYITDISSTSHSQAIEYPPSDCNCPICYQRFTLSELETHYPLCKIKLDERIYHMNKLFKSLN